MRNPDRALQSRDITLPVFPVVVYGCQSWTIKKAEYWRIDAFELWCWRRLMRVPWTARRSNQSILKEISPEYSSEGLMLKLKLQYFVHLMWRTDSFGKTLMLGKIEAGGEGDYKGWDGWMASLTQWTWVWVNRRSWWWTGRSGVLQSMGSQRVGLDRATELNWTEVLVNSDSPLRSTLPSFWLLFCRCDQICSYQPPCFLPSPSAFVLPERPVSPTSLAVTSSLHIYVYLVPFLHPVPITLIFQVVLASRHLHFKIACFAGSLLPAPSAGIGLGCCESF